MTCTLFSHREKKKDYSFSLDSGSITPAYIINDSCLSQKTRIIPPTWFVRKHVPVMSTGLALDVMTLHYGEAQMCVTELSIIFNKA